MFCKLSPLQLKLYNAFLNSTPVQALLASTATYDLARPTAGGARKRKSTKAAAADNKENVVPALPDAQQHQQPEDKGEPLAPLVAITALKKLCCHPDLIWEMLNKHKVADKERQQQQQMQELMAAQRRVSGRAAAAGPRNYSALAAECDSDEEPKPGGKQTGKFQNNN